MMKKSNAILKQVVTCPEENLIEEIKMLLKLKFIAITQENKKVLFF